MTKRWKIQIVIFGTLVGLFALVVHQRRLRERRDAVEARRADDRNANVPLTGFEPSWGEATAPVTLIVFGDLQCPFLARVMATLEEVKVAYGPHKLRIIWKHRPAAFHPEARAAAIAAQIVSDLQGSVAFFGFASRATQNQQALTPSNFEKWAAEQNVSPASLYDLQRVERAGKKVDDDRALIRGFMTVPEDTPTIYVNGMLPDQLDVGDFSPLHFEDLKKLIDAQLVVAAAVTKRIGSVSYLAIAQENADREARGEHGGGMRAYRTPPRQDIAIGNAPTLGPADAVVTIIELNDFTCTECKRVSLALVALQKRDPTKIRLVWMNRPMPFDPNAEPAADLALEALAERGNDEFWKAHDALLAAPSLSGQDLVRITNQLGLDPAATSKAILGRKYKPAIDADQRVAFAIERGSWSDNDTYPRYGSLDGGLTPLVVVNGQPIAFEDLESSVKEALAAAKPDDDAGSAATRSTTALGSKTPVSHLWNEGI
ncbi:MAG: thioredoxin domain-containing protein, partial [Polyangiaceae bacterium]